MTTPLPEGSHQVERNAERCRTGGVAPPVEPISRRGRSRTSRESTSLYFGPRTFPPDQTPARYPEYIGDVVLDFVRACASDAPHIQLALDGRIDRWLVRAATVSDPADLFEA